MFYLLDIVSFVPAGPIALKGKSVPQKLYLATFERTPLAAPETA